MRKYFNNTKKVLRLGSSNYCIKYHKQSCQHFFKRFKLYINSSVYGL